MAEKMTQMTFLTKQIVDLITQDSALASRLTNIEKDGGLIAVAKSEAIADAASKDAALHTVVTGEIATAKSEAISTAAEALASAIEQEVLDRNSAIATAKSEAIADAASKDAALYETVTSDIATAKAAAEEVAAADATTKANAAQVAAEATAAAANALTEAKLSAEGEVAFTAESTVRGAITEINSALKGKADLDEYGKVLASQLPSYVDDVKEVYVDGNTAYSDAEKTSAIALETDKIYVDLVSNKTYRFSGTVLVEISQSLAIGETAETAFAGNRGKQAEEDIDALEGRMSTAEGEIDVLQAATTGYDANNTVAGAIATAKSEAQAAAEATAASALAAKAAELVEAIEDAQAAAEATAAADATSKADAAQNAAISASTAALANEVTERNAAIATAKAEAIAAAEGTAAAALAQEAADRSDADTALQNKLYSAEETPFTAESTVRAAITAVDGKADANAGNITSLTTRVSNLESANATEEADIDALEGRMDTAEADIDAIQAAIGDGTGAGSLSARMAAAEGDIDVLQAIHARGVKVVSEDPAGTAVTFNYTTEAALHVTAEISSLTNIVPTNFGIGCSGYILVDASSEMYTINGKAVPNPLKELVSEFTHGVFRVTCVNTDDYVIELVRFVPVEETVNA